MDEGQIREAALRKLLEHRLGQRRQRTDDEDDPVAYRETLDPASANAGSEPAAAVAYVRQGAYGLRRSDAPPSADARAAPQVRRNVLAPTHNPPLPPKPAKPPLPPPAAPESRRKVSVPPAAFEATSNGMGLQRKRGAPPSSVLPPGPISVNFKKRRLADAAREAKAHTLCAHFCRHGRCDSTRECPYEHDPMRVAICQPFLHGRCRASLTGECLLSHTPTPETMPTCRLYARGLCVDVACARPPADSPPTACTALLLTAPLAVSRRRLPARAPRRHSQGV